MTCSSAIGSGVAAGKSFLLDVLGIDPAAVAGATDLAMLSDALTTELNELTSPSTFLVTAGLYDDWSELRLQLSFDASKDFQLSPALSAGLTDALAGEGLNLSAMGDIDARVRLGGLIDVADGTSTPRKGSTLFQSDVPQ